MTSSVRTFIGFILAGGSATVINYGLFAGLYWAGANYLVASAIGYASGIAVSFTINRFLVFTESSRGSHQILRYTLIYLAALGVQLALLDLGVRAGVEPLIANAIALVIVFVANYFVIKKFVFDVGRDNTTVTQIEGG